MKDRRGLRGNQKWSKEVKWRDKYACRRCNVGVDYELHAHHIKHREMHPKFALVLENGLTLCAQCHYTWHRLLTGNEDIPDLRAFMPGFMPDDAKIDWQLRTIEGKFTRYLERKLESEFGCIREEGVLEMFRYLDDHPNSLSEMVQLLVFVVDSKNWLDGSDTMRAAIEWLHKTTEEKLEFSCRTCQEKLRVNVTNGSRPIQQRFDCKQCLSSYEYGTIRSGAVRISTQHPIAAQAIGRYEQRVGQRRSARQNRR